MDTKLNTVQVVSEEAEKIILAGRRRYWRFRLMKQKGVLREPRFMNDTDFKKDFLYSELTDFTTLPGFVLERLEAVQGFRIAQVIIGHEVVVAPESVEAPETAPERRIDIDTADIARGALGLFTVALVAGLSIFAYAAAGAFSMIDPQLIVVLAESEEWVLLIAWEA